ncbi:MAG TPA: bi-domain-containing oxidoreductase [Terriglobales bacterium]|nr:bi-domain-containing oxidoreductase [Terriglobales bacterium]
MRPGTVLVRTAFSAISAGTERNTLETAKKSLLGKAIARPDLVKQVIDFAKGNGAFAAYQKVRTRLDSFTSLGYSSAGTVLASGDGVTDLQPGDRVACGGVGYACHSEINVVPINLVAKVPESVSLEAASLTTIGAIAIQGLRQAGVAFGDSVLVVGTGLLGVISIQLARAAGTRVIGLDRDPVRVTRAAEYGAHLALSTNDPALPARVQEFTRNGPDVAIITAASTSVEPVELAAKLLRDRGRIVVLGSVPLGVSRELMYRKELSLVLSRSYGPGRYDPTYEEAGIDYPIGYVRWTEKRNMEAFLDLMSSKVVDVRPLLSLRYSVDQGAEAYDEIGRSGAYTAIIQYSSAQVAAPPSIAFENAPINGSEELRVGCIGAGNFARGVIFPVLRRIPKVRFQAIATATGISAFAARNTFGFRRAIQAEDLLSSADIDAVFVLSRHDTHARYVTSALLQQKPVFVEKPLALERQQLAAISDAYNEQVRCGQRPFVMVGFNRRFAPATEQLRRFFAKRQEPMLINIRINAGYLSKDHWSQWGSNGGRLAGETCHFIDWSRVVVGSSIRRVYAASIPDGSRYNRDNVVLTLSFSDGSIANIAYLSNGDRALGKELYEVFCEGGVARIDDFQSIEFFREGKHKRARLHGDKGHREELLLTIRAMRKGEQAPIPFHELVEVSETVFAAIDSLQYAMPVEVPFRSTLSERDSAVLINAGRSE